MERDNTWPGLICTTLIFLLLNSWGCVDEQEIGGGTQGKKVMMEMTIPGLEIPTVTRSMEDEKGEAAVSTIDLLIFDKSTPARLIRHLKIDDFSQEISGEEYKVQFQLELQKDENAGSVVVVANAAKELDAALPENPVDLEKQDLLEALIFKTAADKEGSYKWNVSSSGYTPIPMYGEVSVSNITPGMKITGIELIRMLARIDVENKVNGSVFNLQEIYLVNYHTGGFIAPAWNPSTGALLQEEDETYPYTKNLNPVLPASAGKPEGTQEAAMKYVYSQGNNSAGPLLAGEIYAYEEPKADTQKGVCLILKGNYKGTEYYYRVNFTSDKTSTGNGPNIKTGDNVPLYRNHKYIVTVTAAEGIGYSTFDQALNASTVLSNLKTSILIVDMTGIKNIVYDGQYFMGTESKIVDIPWSVSKELMHRVSSDYHDDWKAEVIDSTTTAWLKFANGNASDKGTDINQSGLDLRIATLASPWSGSDYVSGRIVFTAGRLRDTMIVQRVPIANVFARSNIVFRSGKLTFAVTAEDNATIPANSQGVFFKWGSLLAFASVGNPYDPVRHVVYNPTGYSPGSWGGGLEGWDRVPYAHEDFGFTTPPLTGEDMDAFKEYEGQSGFNENKGIGDICRFISGKDGWVEGKWRLPTYKELDLLYKESPTKPEFPSGGDFKNVTAVLEPSAGSYSDGTYLVTSGLLAGLKATGSTVTAGEMKTPPDGTLFLPVSGHRYPNGDGAVVHIGAYGYYWSSTPTDDIAVYYPFLYRKRLEFSDADRSYGYPIRCIRDY
ncbi:hypothetical protein [uncultured Parabacteroides sp.]|uniref:hypothetical protein n=1 Tax=uncultured Parabacteroides sp. TaxID=512312 RepID=UPI00258DB253|nr:hypothetical protein [uncultured Parabacteroides sp.]